MDTTKLAADLVMGDKITFTNASGKEVTAKVYRVRRFSHVDGLLSTSYAEFRVKLNSRFTLVE